MHLLVFERQKRNRKMGDKGEDSLVCRKCGRLTEGDVGKEGEFYKRFGRYVQKNADIG